MQHSLNPLTNVRKDMAKAKKAAPKKAAAKKAAPKKVVAKKAAPKKAAPKKVAPKKVVAKVDPKKPLTKAQIVEHLSAKLEVTKKQSAMFLDELALLAAKNAKKTFTIPGIGKVSTAVRKARKGRNPQTGEEIKIARKSVVKLKVGKALQDAVFAPKK
jgi:DNA-binding protein HU-beta